MEDWKKDLIKDKSESEKNNQLKFLAEGKNVFVIDLSTKEKVIKRIKDGDKELDKTYILYDLIGDDKEKISLTSYQYSMLLKEMGDIEKLTKIIEVIADVKTINNKKVYTFIINNKED